MDTKQETNTPIESLGVEEVMTFTKKDLTEATKDAIKEVDAAKIKVTSNTTTVILPSNGLINPAIKEVTLRRMTTKEIKTLHTSKDPNFLTVLIMSCIVEPVNITEKDLHPNDVIYLIFILRYISSPRHVEQRTICNHCKKEFKALVEVASLAVNYIDPEKVDLSVHLTEADCLLDFKVLSEGEIIQSEKIAARQVRQGSSDDEQWYKIISKLAYMIVSVEGKEFETFNEKISFLESLSAYDFETFRKAYDDITSQFGLDRNFVQECPHCKRDVEVMAYFAPDFFRLV